MYKISFILLLSSCCLRHRLKHSWPMRLEVTGFTGCLTLTHSVTSLMLPLYDFKSTLRVAMFHKWLSCFLYCLTGQRTSSLGATLYKWNSKKKMWFWFRWEYWGKEKPCKTNSNSVYITRENGYWIKLSIYYGGKTYNLSGDIEYVRRWKSWRTQYQNGGGE